ncbi:DNA/RNA non-specific endonuclease [Pinibacter aurantiacus]|uniref:DNA/RNA non-specific endonuclease n=1 Tax=Pinibacter aurantiacus TaxID=2851599 RepID=A0A9E2W7U0_9BACT|nr:DNA/RNA non-specific endonuclease [Pinibacter aurantiacus]MBV4357256.1 DNA/RNA non-specific endonuclease [Pinibacter aurantiacus]
MTSVLDKAFAKATLLACKGYAPAFINNNANISLNSILSATYKKSLPKVEGNTDGFLNYTDLTVLYDADRKVPFFSAYNIDGGQRSIKVSRANKFRLDPRIDPSIQLNSAFYDLRTDITEFEIGHMAANNEMAWGVDAQLKAYQTFHFPNSVPQAENLNTGIWKTLETYIIDESATIESGKKICVFTGPLLLKTDPGYIKQPDFKIPLFFFKVIVFMSSKGLYSTAFMMSHEQRMKDQHMFATIAERGLTATADTTFKDFKYRKVFQVNVGYLEDISGMNFTWKGVKKVLLKNGAQIQEIAQIKDASDAQKHEDEMLRGAGSKLTKKYKLNITLP